MLKFIDHVSGSSGETELILWWGEAINTASSVQALYVN